MFGLLAGLHALLFRAVLWAIRLPLKSLWALVLSIVALLGEEARRWLGVLVAGGMIFAVSWVTLKVAAQQRLALLLVLLAGMTWLWAVFRAAHLTAENRVWRVRQRQMFKELRGEVGDLRGSLSEGLARRARGTPMEGLWKGNRTDRAREQAEADAAAAQAERERAEQAAWEQAVAAKRAEREQFAAAAAARRRSEA